MHVDVDETGHDEMIPQLDMFHSGGSGPDTRDDVCNPIALQHECARAPDTFWKDEIRP